MAKKATTNGKLPLKKYTATVPLLMLYLTTPATPETKATFLKKDSKYSLVLLVFGIKELLFRRTKTNTLFWALPGLTNTKTILTTTGTQTILPSGALI